MFTQLQRRKTVVLTWLKETAKWEKEIKIQCLIAIFAIILVSSFPLSAANHAYKCKYTGLYKGCPLGGIKGSFFLFSQVNFIQKSNHLLGQIIIKSSVKDCKDICLLQFTHVLIDFLMNLKGMMSMVNGEYISTKFYYKNWSFIPSTRRP